MIARDYVDHRDAEQLKKHVVRLAKRREAERADAADFLHYGDAEGREPHSARCLHVTACEHDSGCKREGCRPCERAYDPLPYPEAMPEPVADYVGTGIGALYGLGFDARPSTLTTHDEDWGLLKVTVSWPSYAAQLAGWNVPIRAAA